MINSYIDRVDKILVEFFINKDLADFEKNLSKLFDDIISDNVIDKFIEGGIGKLLVVIRYLINKSKVYKYSGAYDFIYNSIFNENITINIVLIDEFGNQIVLDYIL